VQIKAKGVFGSDAAMGLRHAIDPGYKIIGIVRYRARELIK